MATTTKEEKQVSAEYAAPAPAAAPSKQKRVRKPMARSPQAAAAAVKAQLVDPSEVEFDDESDLQEAAPPAAAVDAAAAGASAQGAGAPAPSSTPAVPQHSRTMLRRSAEVGLTSEEAASLTSDELLDEILYRQHQQFLMRQDNRHNTPSGDLFPEQFAEQQQQAAQVEDDDGLGLDEMTDPTVAAALRRLAKENKELRDEIGKSREREEVRERDARNDRIDRFFMKLPAEYHDIFGTGTLAESSPEEVACRQAILTVAANDKTNLPAEKKWDRAVKTVYRRQQAAAAPPPAPGVGNYVQAGAKPAAPAAEPDAIDEALDERKKAWANAGVSAPTSRNGSAEPKGIVAAKKSFLRQVRQAGLDGNEIAIEETDELPD